MCISDPLARTKVLLAKKSKYHNYIKEKSVSFGFSKCSVDTKIFCVKGAHYLSNGDGIVEHHTAKKPAILTFVNIQNSYRVYITDISIH